MIPRRCFCARNPSTLGAGLALLTGLLSAFQAEAQAIRLEPIPGTEFDFRDQTKLKQPSGLALDEENQILWTVDDDKSRLFRLDLDGRSMGNLRIMDGDDRADVDGLEGITLLPSGELAIVREDPNEVLIVDPKSGALLDRQSLKAIDRDKLAWLFFENDDSDNNGLEGIAFEPGSGKLLALKERQPRLLMKLAPDLDAVTSAQTLNKEDGFDAPSVKDEKTDVSGIAVDAHRGLLWILSAEGAVVFAFDLVTERAMAIPLKWDQEPVKKAEGIAVNMTGDTMFVVTDDEPKSRFLKYRIVEN